MTTTIKQQLLVLNEDLLDINMILSQKTIQICMV